MEHRHPIAELQHACPSCRTRLRISLKANVETEFVCPECGSALKARSASNGDVAFSPVENTLSLDRSTVHPASQSWRTILGNSRTIATVMTAFFGILLAIFLTPSVGEPDRRRFEDHGENPDDARLANSGTADETPIEAVREGPGTVATGLEVAAREETSNSLYKPATVVEPANPLLENATVLPTQTIVADQRQPPADVSAIKANDVTPGRTPGTIELTSGTHQLDSSRQQNIPEIGSPDDIRNPPAPMLTSDNKTVSKPMSVRQRLGISIVSFRQSDAVPLRELIRTIEQMCRVRVDVSAAPVEQLETPVAVALTETTPAAILTEAARKCGLRVIVDEDSVRMVASKD